MTFTGGEVQRAAATLKSNLQARARESTYAAGMTNEAASLGLRPAPLCEEGHGSKRRRAKGEETGCASVTEKRDY